jgi:hypothetical protein
MIFLLLLLQLTIADFDIPQDEILWVRKIDHGWGSYTTYINNYVTKTNIVSIILEINKKGYHVVGYSVYDNDHNWVFEKSKNNC